MSVFYKLHILYLLSLLSFTALAEPKEIRIMVQCDSSPEAMKEFERWPQIQREIEQTAGTADLYLTWSPTYTVDFGKVRGEFLALVAPRIRKTQKEQEVTLNTELAFGRHRQTTTTEDILVTTKDHFESHIYVTTKDLTPAFAMTTVNGEKYFSACKILKNYVF